MKEYLPDKDMVVMTRDQVRSFDSWAINQLGIPSVVLMENAGGSCARLIKEKLADIKNPKVCIFCGIGNNGGDGYVIGRHLRNNGIKVTVVICGNSSKVKGDARTNLDILQQLGQPIEQIDINSDNIVPAVNGFCSDADMIVDCLFGTGLSGQLRGNYVQLINTLNSQKLPILAVDIPSGLDCDTAEPVGGGDCAIRAAYTVTFVAVKKGFTRPRALEYTGQLFTASIGVEPADRPCD